MNISYITNQVFDTIIERYLKLECFIKTGQYKMFWFVLFSCNNWFGCKNKSRGYHLFLACVPLVDYSAYKIRVPQTHHGKWGVH